MRCFTWKLEFVSSILWMVVDAASRFMQISPQIPEWAYSRNSRRRCPIKRCSWKFRNFHKKTLVPESLFLIKLQVLPRNFIIEQILAQTFSCKLWKNFICAPFLHKNSGRLFLWFLKINTGGKVQISTLMKIN